MEAIDIWPPLRYNRTHVHFDVVPRRRSPVRRRRTAETLSVLVLRQAHFNLLTGYGEAVEATNGFVGRPRFDVHERHGADDVALGHVAVPLKKPTQFVSGGLRRHVADMQLGAAGPPRCLAAEVTTWMRRRVRLAE